MVDRFVLLVHLLRWSFALAVLLPCGALALVARPMNTNSAECMEGECRRAAGVGEGL